MYPNDIVLKKRKLFRKPGLRTNYFKRFCLKTIYHTN